MRRALEAVVFDIEREIRIGYGIFSDEQISLVRTALSSSPGESLERVRREAQIEALEKLPCEYANEQGGETCLDSIESDELVFCPRCRALAELRKGGEK